MVAAGHETTNTYHYGDGQDAAATLQHQTGPTAAAHDICLDDRFLHRALRMMAPSVARSKASPGETFSICLNPVCCAQ